MNNKTVCLNMIVKNESKVIERCLASIKNLIDYWIIVDTGSCDGTQQIIKEYLNDMPGALYERPWVNFSHNRNEALVFAKDKGDYLLFIDADDYLEISDSFKMPDLVLDCYAIEFIHGGCRSAQVLFANNRIDWKWKGVVHEAIDYSAASGLLLKGIINKKGYDGNRSIDLRKKYFRDAQILETALQDEPHNAQYVFHLGVCCEAAEQYEPSLKYYEKRVEMDDDPFELYFSFYRIGALQERLNMKSELFINSYLKAFAIRPHRLEPLYYLANYFIQNNCPVLGYLISGYALSVPFRDDFFFTQYPIYEYGLKDQFALCASQFENLSL
jgi:glycosyltransferase involved in cell wall biosynthesis